MRNFTSHEEASINGYQAITSTYKPKEEEIFQNAITQLVGCDVALVGRQIFRRKTELKLEMEIE